MKRIIAGLLSFILIASNPMIAMATEADAVDNTVSGNEVMLEMEEIISEEEIFADTTVSENSVSENTVSENEITATEIADEPENPEETTENSISAEHLELVEEAKQELQGYIGQKDLFAIVYLTDFYPVKAKADADSDTVVSVPSARTVQILGMEVEWEYQEEWEEYIPTVWYETQFYEGETLYRGYIEEENLAYSDELLLQWKNDWFMFFPKAQALYSTEGTYSASVSYTDVNLFPVSYRTALRKLKDAHPNWTFVPMNVNRNWSDCVSEQMGNYSWIYYNQPAEYRGAKINSTWYYASKAGIEYYMDPRNFLTESNIFQFEQNTYNASYHSVSALQSFLNNTFMKEKVPGDPSGRTYAQVIYNSGKSRNLSPFNLAARVLQEQGINGTSAMISGTYSGYEGYYNHYNISASGTTNEQVLRNGLAYAKKMGWNTRTKSLEGGAEFIGNGYILQGQDTLYLQKFDIEHGSSSLHQYMQNIMAPYTEGRSMKTMYTNAGSLNSAFVFKIPVFKNMPSEYTFSLNKSSLTLQRGIDGKETYQLYVKCNGDKLTEGTITYKSDNTNVAKVDSSTGVITAVAGGKADIQVTVKFDGVEETLKCAVTVKVPLKEIFLNIEEQDLFLCESLPDKIAYIDDEGLTQYIYKDKGEVLSEVVLEVTYNPTDTTDSKKVTWSVADSDIISLTKQGDNDSQAMIKPLKAGTTTVTAKVGTCVKKAEITVRVPMMKVELKPNDIWEGIGNPLTLHTGESTLITASYEPHNTSDRIEPVWTSEDSEIIEIKDGRIIAKKAGKTILHASIGPFDGSQDELSVDVVVEDYKVTFKDVDGTVLLAAPGKYGKSLSNLTVEEDVVIPWDGIGVSGEGYFVGWYTAENGAGDAVTDNTVLYGNMTLYPYFVAEDIAEFYIKPVGSITYTGAYIKPEIAVYSNDTLLKKNVDYTVTYKNNKNVKNDADIASAPTITVKGKGAYAGLEANEIFCIVPKNISHTDVTTKNVEAEYTGKIQKARPVIADAGRTLQRNVDYTLEYTDVEEGAYLEAGTYPVKITGIGNYTGVRYAYIIITKRVMMEDVSISVPASVKFNNGKAYTSVEEIEACRPAVTVKYAGKTLKEGTDYILAYSDNMEIGTATVAVIGEGSYIGNRTVRFLITGTDIATTTVTGLGEREYTGEAIEIDNLTVVDKNKKTLACGLDYTVSYKNNVKNGKASVIITGINGYSNQVIKTFTITPCNIAKSKDIQAELLSETFEYNKSGVKPEVMVSYKGEVLRPNTDYKISYKNNSKVAGKNDENAPSVVITGKGKFTGEIVKTFDITPKDIADVSIKVKDIQYKNREGFCFVAPVLTDAGGRQLKAGVDYQEDYLYTYDTDVVLTDGTIRYAGEKVLKSDIPTPGELKDAAITVTITGTGNYMGTISATYRILEKTSWFEQLFGEEEEPQLNINRTVLNLDPIYPEITDAIKLGVDTGILSDKTTVTYKGADGKENAAIGDLFTVTLEDGKLTIALNGEREDFLDVLPDGYYHFVIVPVVEIEGEECTFSERTVTVRIYRNNPEVVSQLTGEIDLLYRDSTAVNLSLQLSSEVDALKLPQSSEQMDSMYRLTGKDALNYRIVYEDSEFTDEKNIVLGIKAVEDSYYTGEKNTGSEQIALGVQADLALEYETVRGVKLELPLVIVPVQSAYEVAPYTTTCYVKKEVGIGQIVFTSTQPVSYDTVVCESENVVVSVTGRKLSFTVSDVADYVDGDLIPLTVSMYAKGAGKGTVPQTFEVTLLICDETELEKLFALKDTTEKTLAERQETKTSYEETREINNYDKQVIAANTVDFSDTKIAFLGDSITAGAGLEKIGVEENVYTTVVKRALNPEAVERFGYGGYGMSYLGDSLLEKYENIPLDTDIIFVLAGVNDVYDGSEGEFGGAANLSHGTFCGDTYKLMTSLQTRYPNAEIIFLTPLSTITNTWYKEFLPDMLPMDRYVNAIKELGKMTGVTVWDLYNENLLDSYDENILSEYMRDGVHPGVAGHRVLGEHIASELIRMKMEE